MMSLKDRFKLPKMQCDLCITPCSIAVDGEKEGFEVPIFTLLKYKHKSVGLTSSAVTVSYSRTTPWRSARLNTLSLKSTLRSF